MLVDSKISPILKEFAGSKHHIGRKINKGAHQRRSWPMTLSSIPLSEHQVGPNITELLSHRKDFNGLLGKASVVVISQLLGSYCRI
jgi:hypothetical protein